MEYLSFHQILDSSSSTGWVNFLKPPTFNENGSQFVYISSQFQKDANDSYPHLTLISMDTGKQTVLTSGKFVVLDVLHWSEDTDTIFYAANDENASYVKHVWSIEVNNPSIRHCLTCQITQADVSQTYFSVQFSSNGNHIAITNDGPSIPCTDIVRLSTHNSCKHFFTS